MQPLSAHLRRSTLVLALEGMCRLNNGQIPLDHTYDGFSCVRRRRSGALSMSDACSRDANRALLRAHPGMVS